MPRTKPLPSMEELEFSGHASNPLIGTPAGSVDSDAASVSSDWSASKRSRGAVVAAAPGVSVGLLQPMSSSSTFATTTLGLAGVMSDHPRPLASFAAGTPATLSSSVSSLTRRDPTSSIAPRAPASEDPGPMLASRPSAGVGRSRSHVLPRLSHSDGIPLLTCNGQSGKRSDDGVLDSVLHRKNFLTQASWPRVMVALVLDCAAALFECAANRKPVPDIGSEQVVILFGGSWDTAASAIYQRLEYEDAVTESSERRIADPTERAAQARAAVRAAPAGATSHGGSLTAEQAQQAVHTEEALLRRMREVGSSVRLRPSTLRCSAGRDATGCAVLTSRDFRVAVRDADPSVGPPPAATGTPPERRSGSHTGEASLVYGLGCILHSLVYVSARDRRTHVPPPPAVALDLIARCKAADARRRPSLDAVAAHPFLASAHLFLGLASQAAFAEEVRKLRSGARRGVWWRSVSPPLPKARSGVHPVGKMGGRHRHLSVPPPPIGAGAFSVSATPFATASATPSSSSSASVSSSASSASTTATPGATAGIGGRSASSRRRPVRPPRPADSGWMPASSRPSRAPRAPRAPGDLPLRSGRPSSSFAARVATADLRAAGAALAAASFAGFEPTPSLGSSPLGSGCRGSAHEDEDEADLSDDFDRISIESAKPATAADVAGLGLGPHAPAQPPVRPLTVQTAPGGPAPAAAAGMGAAPLAAGGLSFFPPDRIAAFSRGLSPRARADMLAASEAMATKNVVALVHLACDAPSLVPVTSNDSADLAWGAAAEAGGSLDEDEDDCEDLAGMLGEGIRVAPSADSTVESSISSDPITAAPGTAAPRSDIDEDARGLGNVSAFTVDAVMGRVGKRGREATSSSSSSSSSSGGGAHPAAWAAPAAASAFLPQPHPAGGAQGLGIVPFAQSRPVMPAGAGSIGSSASSRAPPPPVLPHGVPDSSAFAAPPLRVSASASPDASPGVTTIAPSPTAAAFGAEVTLHSPWQPRATRPVVATDGTLELSHPALCRQITGGL